MNWDYSNKLVGWLGAARSKNPEVNYDWQHGEQLVCELYSLLLCQTYILLPYNFSWKRKTFLFYTMHQKALTATHENI